MAYLILVRHGQSEWNALGLWTGITDVSLTEEGRKEAQRAAETLKDIPIHSAHTSKLKRAKDTLAEIKKVLKIAHIPTTEHEALNERDYGEFTGKNKLKIQEEHGDEQYQKIRRGWDHPIKGGESLKDVHERIVPYYKGQILKDLKEGKNVIIAAHGNSLRALIKHLENIPDIDVPKLEIATGQIHLYEIDEEGNVKAKEIKGTGGAK